MKRILAMILSAAMVLTLLPATVLAADAVYYVDAESGSDANPGTVDNPLATLKAALALVGANDATIVLMSSVKVPYGDDPWPAHSGTATITSYYGENDYRKSGAELYFSSSNNAQNYRMAGPVELVDLNIATDGDHRLNAQGYDLTIGEGIVCTRDDEAADDWIEIVGGGRDRAVKGDPTVTIASGTWADVYAATSKSGNTGSLDGSATLVISGGTVVGKVAAGNNGTVTGSVNITITGGTLADVSGSMNGGSAAVNVGINLSDSASVLTLTGAAKVGTLTGGKGTLTLGENGTLTVTGSVSGTTKVVLPETLTEKVYITLPVDSATENSISSITSTGGVELVYNAADGTWTVDLPEAGDPAKFGEPVDGNGNRVYSAVYGKAIYYPILNAYDIPLAAGSSNELGALNSSSLTGATAEIVKHNGGWYLEVTANAGGSGLSHIKGTVTLSGQGTAEYSVSKTFKLLANDTALGKPVNTYEGDSKEYDKRVDQISSGSTGAQIAHPETGLIGFYNWDGSDDEDGVEYIAAGGTIYYYLYAGGDKTGVSARNYVVDEAVVLGAEFDVTDLSGSENIQSTAIVKKASSNSKERYYAAITLKDTLPEGQRLAGTLKIKNDTEYYGFNKADNTISKEINLGIGEPSTGGDPAAFGDEPVNAAGNRVYNAVYGEPIYYPVLNASGMTLAAADGVDSIGALTPPSLPGAKVEIVKHNGGWYLEVTANEGGSGLSRIEGTVTLSGQGTAAYTVDKEFKLLANDTALTPFNTYSGDPEEYDKRVNQISSGSTGAQIAHPETGRIGSYNWDGSDDAETDGVDWIPAGGTVYYYLYAGNDKSGINVRNNVTDEEVVFGAEFDFSELTNGEYVTGEIVKKTRDNGSMTRYYAAVTVSENIPQGERLTGTLKIKNDTDFFGFSTDDNTISYNIDLRLGEGVAGVATEISRELLNEFDGVVKVQTADGSYTSSLGGLPYGYAAYFALVDGKGDYITGDLDVDNIDVKYNFGANQSLVSGVELVKLRFDKSSADTAWFVKIQFVDKTEDSETVKVTGNVTLTHNGDWAGEFGQKTLTLSSRSFEVRVIGPADPQQPPTEGDPGRIYTFLQTGVRLMNVWPLVEDEDHGGLVKPTDNRGMTIYDAGALNIAWGSTVYYPLLDCDGDLITDEKYVSNMKFSDEYLASGNRIESVSIEKKRIELGEGSGYDGVYGYCVAVKFVYRNFQSSYDVDAYVTLKKTGKYGIATEDNELKLFIDVYLSNSSGTLRQDFEDHPMHNQFQDRVLSEDVLRYNFADPAYEKGVYTGNSWTLGTNEEDVIYFTDDQTAYITIDTRNQGRMLLGCSTIGRAFIYDVYPEADLQFYMTEGSSSFKKNGVVTIELPSTDHYLYEVQNGVLIKPTKGSIDENGVFTMRSKSLGSWCVSDIELDLDRQFKFEYDEFYYTTEGMSKHNPTSHLVAEMAADALAEYPNKERLTLYVNPGVEMPAVFRRWAAENLDRPLDLVSNYGWVVSFEPEDFDGQAKAVEDIVIDPRVETTPYSVVLYMEGNNPGAYPLPMRVALAHRMLPAISERKLYGKGKENWIDFGALEMMGDYTVHFEVDRDMLYIISGLELDHVITLEEAKETGIL